MLPRLFEGAPCYVLGGGASLTREVCDSLRGLNAIACNSTVRLAPWVEVLYFHDWQWFRDHRPLIDSFHGHIATASIRAKGAIKMDRKTFHHVAPPTISFDKITAGHAALDVAVAMGARRVVLLRGTKKMPRLRGGVPGLQKGGWS
jgi:hypothetical protein